MTTALRVLAVAASWVLTLCVKLSKQTLTDTSGGPPLDGFQRAAAHNACPTTDYPERGGWGNIPIARQDLKAVYFLEGKAASSTIRKTLGKTGQNFPVTKANFHNYTDSFKFTMVRDPLERLVSVFWEEGYGCAGLKSRDFKSYYHAENPHHRKEVFDSFKKFVGLLENGKCWGPHTTMQRSRLPNPKILPMDFVGLVSNLRDDWKTIAQHQGSKFHAMEWPSLAKSDRETDPKLRHLFNVTHIRPQLAQRVCNAYREDYCCFELPVPHPCKVDCSK
eukprot:TRINITY_DN13858_c0_g1_i5.p1 TRINITY_DN13858_c0_g1~~TRINITY_DN13858_c0_g1_i5.p1  ORF type:complete len:293 (-),score=32.63 TRINITY_DN13858_c0_g1_i5:166-996(-)